MSIPIMWISKLNIVNYRSIEHEEFDLRPLSTLIGKNNVGKTNLIYSIKMLLEGTSKDFATEDFFDKSNNIILEARIENVAPYLDLCVPIHRTKIKKCLENDGSLRVQKIIKPGINAGKLNLWDQEKGGYSLPTGIEAGLKQIFPEVIHIEAFHDPTIEAIGKSSATLGKIIKQIIQVVEEKVSGSLERAYANANKTLNVVQEETEAGIKEIDKRADEIKAIEKDIAHQLETLFGKVGVRIKVGLPNLPDLLGNSQLLLLEGGTWTPPDLKGQGLQRALYVALLQTLALQLRKQTTSKIKRPFLLFVEEPEAFLHPSVQMKMRDALEEISYSNQVIIATHCPTMVSSRHFGDVILIRKQEEEIANGKTRTIQLKGQVKLATTEEKERIYQLLSYQRSSKFLFADKVVVVEGPTDVVLFEAITERITKQHPDSLNVSFVESGGKAILSDFVKLIRDLGLYAIGIVDLDFIWKGAGQIFADDSMYSKFINRFRDKLKENRAIQKNADGSEKVNKKKAFALLKKEFQKDIETLATKLQSYNIFLLVNGEIEDYVGLGKRSKGKYLPAAKEIKDGTRELTNIEELNRIIRDGLGITDFP